MPYKTIIPLVVAALVVSSCAPRVPFTQSLRQEYKLTQEELSAIQFYTSDDIVLIAGEGDVREKATTQDGALAIRRGQRVEEIIIPAGTPCVVDMVIDGERLAMRFGSGPKEYLVFGTLQQRGGYYTLQALEWNNGVGTIVYGDKTFTTQRGDNQTYLLIKLKSIRQITRDQQIVRGQRL